MDNGAEAFGPIFGLGFFVLYILYANKLITIDKNWVLMECNVIKTNL